MDQGEFPLPLRFFSFTEKTPKSSTSLPKSIIWRRRLNGRCRLLSEVGTAVRAFQWSAGDVAPSSHSAGRII